MKKTGFNRYVYDFSVDYNAVPTTGIAHIQKYSMLINNMV